MQQTFSTARIYNMNKSNEATQIYRQLCVKLYKAFQHISEHIPRRCINRSQNDKNRKFCVWFNNSLRKNLLCPVTTVIVRTLKVRSVHWRLHSHLSESRRNSISSFRIHRIPLTEIWGKFWIRESKTRCRAVLTPFLKIKFWKSIDFGKSHWISFSDSVSHTNGCGKVHKLWARN